MGVPSPALEQSCSSRSLQKQPMEAELRRDPADGKERTLQATYKVYEDQYTKRQIGDYWTTMQVVQTQTPSMCFASSNATQESEAIPGLHAFLEDAGMSRHQSAASRWA